MKKKIREDTSIEFNIFYNQPTGMLAFNSEFEITICNKAFIEQTIQDEPKLQGAYLFDKIKFDGNASSVKNQINLGSSFKSFINIGKKRFKVEVIPLWGNSNVIGGAISLEEEIVEKPQLDYLSKTGFKSVIENAPMTIMIFRQDGSVFYTNQYYQHLWELSDRELALIHEHYNIFDDKQLNNHAIRPYIKKAFEGGGTVEVPAINYRQDYSDLGRKGTSYKENWLLGHFFQMKNADSSKNLVALIFTEITRQVDAEQAFKLSEKRLELALEGGGIGIWDWHIDSNRVFGSKYWAKALGYQPDELEIASWTNLVHPDDLGLVEKKMDDHIAGKSEFYLAEYRMKSKSGEWKWLLDRGKVVEFTSEEKPKRFLGTYVDITTKKQSEGILKASEERYRSLVNNLPIGVAITQDNRVVYANKELDTILKVEDKNQLVGMDFSKFFNNPKGYLTKVDKILDSGISDSVSETSIKDLHGKQKCVEVTSISLMYNSRPAVQFIVNDVQKRKDNEAQTLRAEKLLSQLFENAPMAIVMLGFDDEILKINKGFEQIFGYTPNEVVGRYINDIIVPTNLIEEGLELSKDSMKGKSKYLETKRVSKTNEKVPVIIHTLPVIHEGQQLGVYGIYIDLRKRIKIEEELKVRNLELDNFVYKVSHDLRSPLASILGLINLVKLEGGFQDSLKYLTLMESQVHKLDHFIHDVLSHSKNLKMSVVTSPINFKEVIDKCISDLSHLKGFDKVAKKVVVLGDGFLSDQWRINEIFRNLVANCIKYYDVSKKQCEMEIMVDISKEGCIISISDNGIGIDKESVPRIFEMFYRATDASKGSGIGLYIVKNAVEKLGGNITLESALGKGTKFLIELPILTSN